MRMTGSGAENIKIAYIGGGSRGWAWQLMSDLALADDISGEVALYDIDFNAAHNNEIIGNKIMQNKETKSEWRYKAVPTIEEALTAADFVIVSILPGTYDEMESDVHTPEKYGIYQSVGDTTGPGGIIRALRTVPMFEEIALGIKKFCPEAWVINYTNPMTVCVKTLYATFPEIKAFGCCHEVFGTQNLLIKALEEIEGIGGVTREEIAVNVLGVNHFTWLTKAVYKNIDLFDVYTRFCKRYDETGFESKSGNNWMENEFLNSLKTKERVKMNLFMRYGYIAAAGDRHLAEFSPGDWFLKNPQTVEKWGFGLTSVESRKRRLIQKNEQSLRLVSGKEEFQINPTGEEGVDQIRALLGMGNMITNVNIPNYGQIPNLPVGAVVETNACFRANSVTPVFAGSIPREIYPLISRISGEQELIVAGCIDRDLDVVFDAFVNDPLVRLPIADARKLFSEMVNNTKNYLIDYKL